jgi:anthranilate synthase component I
MQFEPSFDTFKPAYETGEAQLVYCTMVADLETPVSAYLKLKSAFPAQSFLLESVEGGATRGRYSIIGLAPDLIWRCDGANTYESVNGAAEVQSPDLPLSSLRQLLAKSRIKMPPNLPPMAAGVFGYLGYDMVRQMEKLGMAKPDKVGVPDAILTRPTLMVIFDSVKDVLFIVAPVRPQSCISANQAFEAAQILLERAVASIEGSIEPAVRQAHTQTNLSVPVSNTSEPEYLDMVAKAKEYVKAGDVFQVVLSQRFSSPFPLPPFSLYRALRRVNPAPFLCYLDFIDFQIVCSSPEILVRVRDGEVHLRPIAGTRPRGATPAQDKANAEDLLNDQKELAEHLMLLDLGRNDVGRVSEIGSVKVTDKFFLEYYSHVMHIVSHVTGKLDAKFDAIDALSAGFPAGTVSGAPKIRAMQIIDELEKDKRGIYGGCIGYFGADGDMDTCIVLRTAVVKDCVMHVQAGAGIVNDSVPQSEYQECVHKAKALFSASDAAIKTALEVKRGQ